MRNSDLKYFLYARKSSESEDRQMASIEDQIAEVKKIAEKYNINIVDIISESKSAKEPGRIGFNSMLNRIHKGEAQGILTWKLNRLARNPIDGGQISWMLQQNIIKHIQTFEREYYPNDNVLLMQVEFGMANQYVKDLSLDVKRGMRKKAERGWFPATILPMGYMHKSNYVLGAEDEIVSNPKQYPILKKLWKLFLTGEYSIADIKRKGDVFGLMSKGEKPCSQNSYYKIFTNEFYCGYFNWRDKDDNVTRHKGKHKALVTQAEFQKAQILLSEKAKITIKSRKYDFPYRGIITCGECGCAITPDHKLQAICTSCKYKYSIKNKTSCPKCNTKFSEMKNPSIIDILYYHCTKSKGRCSQGSITKEKIDIFIESKLKKISINRDFHSWIINVLKRKNVDREEDKLVIKKLRRGKTELETRMSRLINLRADGEINAEQFNLSMSTIQKEITSLDTSIEEAEKHYLEGYSNKINAYNFALEVQEKFIKATDNGKTKILRELASNLTLKDKKLYLTMEKQLSEVKESYSAYMPKKALSNLKTSLNNKVEIRTSDLNSLSAGSRKIKKNSTD